MHTAEPSLDEMDRVLAEEEDREGSGPVPLNPSNLASSNTEDRAEHCSKTRKWRLMAGKEKRREFVGRCAS